MKKESQQSQDQWWIWLREAMKGLHQRYLALHQKARGRPDTKVKVPWVRKLRSTMDLSLGSRSFLDRVNDQVRKRQKQSSIDATEVSEEHSVIWGMFMSSTLQASVFMGKNYSDNWHSIKNTEDLTMKQMFVISEKLTSEQSDEIYGVNTINWEDSSWMYLSLIGDEQVISLLHRKVYVFSDSVLCLGKMNENPQSNIAWEDRLTWFKSSQEYRTLGRIWWWANCIRVESVAAQPQSSRVTVEIEWNTREFYRTDCLHVDVQRHLMGIKKTTRKNASQMLNSFIFLQTDSEQDNGHSSDLDQRRNGALSVKIVHKVTGKKWLRRWWWHSQKADIQSSEPRVHCPEGCLKAKVVENCRSTIVPTRKRLQLFSHNYFCKSAQSLRSSRRNVWRIWILSW